MIGDAGQRRLATSRVLLVGCGALGSVVADQLVRAGVGTLLVADRDIVELTNLQRQVLFDEADARDGTPKAVAAAQRLARVNSAVRIEPLPVDVDGGNLESLALSPRVDLILDGTDNAATRYLVNDVSIKHGIPWVYGACVGTEGRVMTILPGQTPCLRCLFPEPPGAGELPTCDTAGVLGPVASVAASLQALSAIKLLSGNPDAIAPELLSFDLWANRIRSVSTGGARRDDCPTCGRHHYEFLDRPTGGESTLCGREAVQLRPPRPTQLDLEALATKLAGAGATRRSRFFLRCDLSEHPGIRLTLFPDGRAIIGGTTDPQRAKSLYSRYIGS